MSLKISKVFWSVSIISYTGWLLVGWPVCYFFSLGNLCIFELFEGKWEQMWLYKSLCLLVGASVQGCNNARMQKCKVAKVQGCKRARMQKCKDAKEQGSKCARMQMCKDASVVGLSVGPYIFRQVWELACVRAARGQSRQVSEKAGVRVGRWQRRQVSE